MRLGQRCIIPGCPLLCAARGRLFCPEHLALLPWDRQERLHALRKLWRRGNLQPAIGNLPPPDGWEKAAHLVVYPGAPGLPSHPYTRWHVAAYACTAWVLTRLWEGAFPLPTATPAHGAPYELCRCPLCAQARASALKALERRG